MKVKTNLTVTLLALFLADALSSPTHAATTVVSYNAGPAGGPAAAPDPSTVDGGSWVAGVPSGDVTNFQSAGVAPDGISDFNAWRMLDNSAAASQNITWNYAFTPQQHADAANNGWRMSARLRAADPVADNAGGNSIVLLYGNNAARRWIAFYDITPTNTLVLTLLGSPTLTFVITDTNVATGYNLHEMEFSPATQRAIYRFNGMVLTTNLNNTTGAYNGVQWGTGSSGGRGDGYWNTVSFEIADPPPLPGVVQDPQSSTNAVGDSVTFTAAFTNLVLGYQWYKDGSPIAGAGAGSYTIPFVTVLDAADYICRATNSSGLTDTAPATLTVLPDMTPPSVVSAIASVFASRVRLRFSEPVDRTTAEFLFNYNVEGFDVTLVTVVDRFTVDLAVAPTFAPASNYTVLVSFIEDTAGNAMPMDVPVSFTAPDGLPVMEQVVAAYDGSSAVAHPTDGMTWRDRSGNENHAVSYSAAANTRPTLRPNSLNGLNTLNFLRPAVQALRVEGTNSTGLGGNAHTWFVVSKPTNFVTGVFSSLARHQSSTDGANWGSYFFPGNAATGSRPGLVANGRNSSGGEVAAIPFPVTPREWMLITGYANGPGSEVFGRVETPAGNTVVTATNTGTPLRFGTPVATWIGTSGAGIASAAFDGEMAEVLIYNGVLDETQRTQVEAYLRAKYFPRAELSIHLEGGNAVVEFTGTLLSGDEATGITNVVSGATSPLTITNGAAKQFYRSRLP